MASILASIIFKFFRPSAEYPLQISGVALLSDQYHTVLNIIAYEIYESKKYYII